MVTFTEEILNGKLHFFAVSGLVSRNKVYTHEISKSQNTFVNFQAAGKVKRKRSVII